MFESIFIHSGHSVYTLKRTNKKVHFLFNKIHTKCYIYKCKKFFVNFKFSVYPYKNFKYFKWLIRFPFFHFSKDNCNIHLGTNKRQLWIQLY